MPTWVIRRESVAPGSMNGTTGTPGHICWDTCSIGPSTLAGSGMGAAIELAPGGWVTVTVGSSIAATRSWRTSSAVCPGMIRQLRVALARWGRAFTAWPASSRVATQVVRSMAWSPGSRLSRASAALSCGLATMAVMAAPVSPPTIFAIRVK